MTPTESISFLWHFQNKNTLKIDIVMSFLRRVYLNNLRVKEFLFPSDILEITLIKHKMALKPLKKKFKHIKGFDSQILRFKHMNKMSKIKDMRNFF